MPLKTALVESFRHQHIADEPIDTAGLPVGEELFRDGVPVVLEHLPGERDELLISPGANHGRSYELVVNGNGENENDLREPWSDQFGNVYTTLVTKGNNFSRARMFRSGTAPSGFIPHGLQEGDALLRVLKASRVMREAGIDTEWVVRIEEPKQLYFEGEFLTPAEYKKRLISKMLARTALAGAGIEPVEEDEDHLSDEEVGEVAKALKGMDFFITLRAMATCDRAQDLEHPERWIDIERIARVFNVYNRIAPYRADDFELLELPDSLSLVDMSAIEPNSSVVKQYFTEVLPRLTALNFARMHNIGLVHHFPTFGNITTLGGIVDLDSVRGTKLDLDDERPDIEAMTRDLEYMLTDVEGDHLTPLMKRVAYYTGEDESELAVSFQSSLICTYLDIRESESSDPNIKKELLEIMATLADHSHLEAAKNYLIGVMYPLVGELVEDEVGEALKETIEPTPQELTDALFSYFMKDDDDYMEVVPSSDDWPPNLETIKNNLREHFGGYKIRGQLVSDDVFEAALVPALSCLRFEQLFAHVDDIVSKMANRLKGSPLEGLNPDHLVYIMIVLSKEIVDDAVHNFVISDPDVVWEFAAAEFQKRFIAIKEAAELYLSTAEKSEG